MNNKQFRCIMNKVITSALNFKNILFFALFIFNSQDVYSQIRYISPIFDMNVKFALRDSPQDTLSINCKAEFRHSYPQEESGKCQKAIYLYDFSSYYVEAFFFMDEQKPIELGYNVITYGVIRPIGDKNYECFGNVFFNKFDTLTHNIKGELFVTIYDWGEYYEHMSASTYINLNTVPPQLKVINSHSDILKTKDTANYRIELSNIDGNKLQGFDVKVKDPFINSSSFYNIGKTNQDGIIFYNRIIPDDAENGIYELTFWATKDSLRYHFYDTVAHCDYRSDYVIKKLSIVDSLRVIVDIVPDEDIEIKVGQVIEYSINIKDETDEICGEAEVWVKNPLISDSFVLAGKANEFGSFVYKYQILEGTEPVSYDFEFFAKKEGFRQSKVHNRKVSIYPKGIFLTVLPSKDMELYQKDSTAFIVYVRNAQDEPVSGAEIFVLDSLTGKTTFTKVDTTDMNGRLIYSIKIPENTSGEFHYKFVAHKADESTDTIARKATVQSGFRCWTYAYGMLEFCIEGNGKWEPEEGKPILKSENAIVINDFLIFQGNLEIDTVNLSMKADGKFYLKEIPLPGGGLGSFTVAEGSYELAFAGPDGKITNFANAILDKVAGFDIKITDLQLVGGRRADGIKFSAKMSIPGISVGCNEPGNDDLGTEFELKDLEISKTKGVQIGGFNVQNLGFKSFPNFCIKELSGSYDEEDDKLAYGANVKIPFGEVGGGLAFSKGKLDSVGFRLEAKFPPLFVIGTSTVGIMGFFGHISNITKPEIEFELGGVLSDITSESLYKIDMSGYYKSPSTIGLKGDGTIFKDPLTDKWQIKGGLDGSIDFAEYQMEISGNINVGTKDEKVYLLIADANMKYNMKQSRLSGAMNGAITLPMLNNGWPYDWINSTLGLPKTTTASARLIYGNMKSIWGYAYFPSPVGNLSYILDLKKSWGEDGFFFFERNSPSSIINVKVYDCDNRILSGDYTKYFGISDNCEKFVLRITANGDIPISELRSPEGKLYKIDNLDPNNSNIHYSNLNEEHKSFWTITSPTAGNWEIIVKESTSNFSIDTYIFDNLPSFRIETQQDKNELLITWDVVGLSKEATIDLFLDKDSYGENGAYLTSVNAIDGLAKITLSDSLSLCKYFVYGVYIGENFALSSYNEKPVAINKTILPAPLDFTAKFNTTTGKYIAEWTPSQNKDIVGYVIYSVEDYGGYEQLVASASKGQSRAEFTVPTHTMFKVKIASFDKNGLMGCPTSPQSIIVGVDEAKFTYTNKYDLFISPNPASEYIDIMQPSEGLKPSEGSEIKIYNTFGECVIFVETQDFASLQRINISHLPVGLYFIQIGDYSEKFVVMR